MDHDTADPSARRDFAPFRLLLLSMVPLLLLGGASACESRDAPPAAWSEVDLAQQPQLLTRRNGHPALSELDGLYLGQSHEEASAALRAFCEETVRRDTTQLGSDAYFLGCRVKGEGPLQFLRVGFWPKIGERVATLELKRDSVPPAAVWERLQSTLDEKITASSLGPRLIEVQTSSYRFFADWEQGLEGPTHIVVGFAPQIEIGSDSGS